MKLTKEQYLTLHTILKMTIASKNEARIIQKFINELIDPECHICDHCGAQIKLGHTRVVKWYEIHKTSIEKYAKKYK